jgi:hypothetical protein
MLSTGEFYRKRISKIWSVTNTSTVKNSELAAFTDLLNPALPDNIRADDRNAGEISYVNSEGLGFTLKKDSRNRIICVFTKAIDYNYTCNLDLIEPESFARFALTFFTSLNGWNKEFEILKVRDSKRKKRKSIAEKNIVLMVEEFMKDRNYQYQLVRHESRVLLNIRIPGRMKIEIPISHRNFITEIPALAPAIEQTLELLNQAGFKIQIKTHGNNITWSEGGKHAC